MNSAFLPFLQGRSFETKPVFPLRTFLSLFRNIEARETFTTLLEISRILNTGLDRETLAICVRLCEQEINQSINQSIERNIHINLANYSFYWRNCTGNFKWPLFQIGQIQVCAAVLSYVQSELNTANTWICNYKASFNKFTHTYRCNRSLPILHGG